jgi:hypothetical protein
MANDRRRRTSQKSTDFQDAGSSPDERSEIKDIMPQWSDIDAGVCLEVRPRISLRSSGLRYCGHQRSSLIAAHFVSSYFET